MSAVSALGTVPDGTVPVAVMPGLSPWGLSPTPAPFPNPFVSSVVETPIGCALPLGLSTSLDANGGGVAGFNGFVGALCVGDSP